MNTKIKLVIVTVVLVLSNLLSACDLSGGLVGPMTPERARESQIITCKMKNPTNQGICK